MTINSNQVHNTNHFTDENLTKMKDIMYDYKVESGTNIFWEGDPSDKLYFIKKGIVKLSKMTDDGKDLTFYYFGQGDMFGEFDCFVKDTCTFSAVAIHDCQIGVIQQSDLEVLLWKNGDFPIEFMKWMGVMQRLMHVKLRDILFYGKNGALASTLIRMTNTFGKVEDKYIIITEKFTNSDIGCLIGATRETVNRMIAQLKKDHVLDIENGYLVIYDLDYLKGICHCEGCPKEICRL
ncbi:Crp/Fnr family transcriptional regulator [Bacillus sp. DJP31]|uniref:Crp/Fnr family transcriptional regulator n=1 Tax=Bacillus sp. DJP31 TaxID=3409789 RepID=UPI003BB7CEB5